MVTPKQRRAAVTHVLATAAVTQRQACRFLGIHRALVRYRSRRGDDRELRARLRELAEQKPRWGTP